MSLLGVDIGTSGLKAVVFDATTGGPMASAQVSYPTLSTRPGQAELDPEAVWSALRSAVGEVAQQPTVRHDPVEAIGWAASGDEIVLLDSQGRARDTVILAADTRGSGQLADLAQTIDASRLSLRTGIPSYPAHPLIRLLWYRDNEPGLLDGTSQAVGWAEFLQCRLGLQPKTDHTSASRWMLFDLETHTWIREVVAALGLPADILPDTAAPGDPIGELGPQALEDLGLHGHVVVVAGAFDQVAATLGAGVLRVGDASIGSGTWEVLSVPIDDVAIIPAALAQGFDVGAFAGPAGLAAFALNPAGGSAMAWLAGLFDPEVGDDGPRPGDASTDAAVAGWIARAPDGPTGLTVVPHLQGSPSPRPDPIAMGAILGLTLATDRSVLVRAWLEGITFQLRANLESMAESGIRPDRFRNTGGGSRSTAWVQLRADILGRPIETVTIRETGCLAAAVLAGVGVGRYDDIAKPIEAFVAVQRRVEPRPEMRDRYQERYESFVRAADAIHGLSVRNAAGRV